MIYAAVVEAGKFPYPGRCFSLKFFRVKNTTSSLRPILVGPRTCKRQRGPVLTNVSVDRSSTKVSVDLFSQTST